MKEFMQYSDVDEIVINNNLSSYLEKKISVFKENEILVVTDEQVFLVYKEILPIFEKQIIHVFKREMPLIPDEKALGEILLKITPRTKLIIAIGSGTLNDLCRFVSFQVKLDYWVIMSAPSMDGYASTASPIMDHGFKKTFYTHGAKKLLGLKHVLEEAPYEMILAGLGDYLGKVTALMDWQLSHYINKESIDFTIIDELYSGMDYIYDKLGNSINEEQLRDLGDYLTQRLIVSGLHMSKVGNSRPASGSEHLISHIFEMEAIEAGKLIPLHGLKVGLATYKILQEYIKIQEVGVGKFLDSYGLSKDVLIKVDDMMTRGLKYMPLITAYFTKVSEFLIYSEEDYKRAMIQGVEIRDRFTILSILKSK